MDIQSENSQTEKTSNRKQVERTALAILMENRAQAFKSVENKWTRGVFFNVTNCCQLALALFVVVPCEERGKPHSFTFSQNSRHQKRNVPKINPSQTSITDYVVIKHRPSTFEHLQKTVNEKEAEESLKWTGRIANKIDSSPRSTCGTDEEDELMLDSSCTIRNDSDNEVNDLGKRLNHTLGKRMNVEENDVPKNVQEPLMKRRKEMYMYNLLTLFTHIIYLKTKKLEEEEKQLVREEENSKKECSKENEAKEADGNVDYFFKTKYSLAIVEKPTILTAGFACIEKVVLKELLGSMKSQEFTKKYTLIDCRYPYEYNGGHIRGALNIYDPAVLENAFFPKCPEKLKIMRGKIPIFYCEYSSARGPLLASHLRKSDRVRNFEKYPLLYYNEIYVLQGGYNSFYNSVDKCFKDLCEPIGYIPMRDRQHSDDLKIYHTHNARNGIGVATGMFQTAVIRKNTDIRRSHSVPQMPESPTAPQFASAQSPEKLSPEISSDNMIPMLANPRTPTGRKSYR
uniref:protein-tyrosine-phosphatase n=1 Tax=Elaeophora elaphi TaxID=1147741 RepID=A0A0R3RX08_9BILA